MSIPPFDSGNKGITQDEYDHLVKQFGELGVKVKSQHSVKSTVEQMLKGVEKEKDTKEKSRKPKATMKNVANTVIANKRREKQGDKKKEDAERVIDAYQQMLEAELKMKPKTVHDRKMEVNVFKEKANKCFKDEDYRKALYFYNRAIEENLENYVLYANRAVTYIKLGLYNLALRDSNSALELDPTNLKALMHKATALFFMKETKEAEEVAEEALKLHPDRLHYINGRKNGWKTPVVEPLQTEGIMKTPSKKPLDNKK